MLKNKNWIVLFLVLVCQVTVAQKTVTGNIKDDTGPLPGATVLIKGTTKGVEADFDGNYSVKTKKGQVLQFQFMGMKTKYITVGDGVVYNVVMEADTQMIEEVEIIATGLTKTDKRLFTGASTKLKAADVKIDGLSDISRSLEGRAAGVSVQNVSGTFGAAPKVRVRGATSIYGSSKPLWVVDGVVMEDVVSLSSDELSSGDATTLISSAIAGLNPDDIESFDVLKDGSATSIYGARAMAGVIVITTKKGKKGHSKISYQNSVTYRQIPRYDNFNIMNSQDEMSVYQELDRKGLLSVSSLLNGKESGVYGDFYKKLYNVNPDGTFEIKNSPEGKTAFLKEGEYRNTNWFKELFNVNALQTHSLGFSSGTDKASFYGSLSSMIDPGWMKSSAVSRYTANLNSSFDIYDNLKLNVITNASLRKQKAPGTVAGDTDVVSGEVKRDFDINPYSFALNTSRAMNPHTYYTRNYAPFNELKELDENYIDINMASLKFQSELKYKVNSKLDLSALASMKYQQATQEHNITEFSNQANAYRAGTDYLNPNSTVLKANPMLYTDPDDQFALPISILPKGGILKRKDNKMSSYDLRASAFYKNTFEGVHSLNVYLGSELNSVDRTQSRNVNYGVQYSNGMTPFYDYRLFKKAIEEGNYYYGMKKDKYGNIPSPETRGRNVAFFGNATYSFDRKYVLNGTVRYEGSNRLGKSTSARWLPTWNVSGAWNVDGEDFFEKLRPTVSSLTLKASYSLTAASGPDFVSNSLVDIRTYNPWRPFAGYKETAVYINNLENSGLTYEKKNEFNLGLETSFIDGRIGFALDWYQRDNKDLIGPVYTQGFGGEIEKFGNVASMKSSGLELAINSTNIKTKDFKWTTSFIYSKTKNEVTDLESSKSVVDLITGGGFGREGYPVRSIFSIPFAGLNSEGLPTFINKDGETTMDEVNLQDRNDVDFLEYSGNADPTDVGSLGNTFKYKGISLNVFTTYSFGNVVRLTPSFKHKYSDFSSLPKELNDRWMVPGDEKFTNIPVIPDFRTVHEYGKVLERVYNIYNYSSERIAKGDFIRLKQVSLGFDFPKYVLENLKVSRLSMKLQATNLFLLYSDDKLQGQDPEFFNSGGVAAPVPKQFTFTLNLTI